VKSSDTLQFPSMPLNMNAAVIFTNDDVCLAAIYLRPVYALETYLSTLRYHSTAQTKV
jgi:hypothetical protein